MKITKEIVKKIIAEELQKEILAERIGGNENPLDQAAKLTGLKGPDQKVDAARQAISPFGELKKSDNLFQLFPLSSL